MKAGAGADMNGGMRFPRAPVAGLFVFLAVGQLACDGGEAESPADAGSAGAAGAAAGASGTAGSGGGPQATAGSGGGPTVAGGSGGAATGAAGSGGAAAGAAGSDASGGSAGGGPAGNGGRGGAAGGGGSGGAAGGRGGSGGAAGGRGGGGGAAGTGLGGAPGAGGAAGGGGRGALPPITVWIAGDSTVANGSTPCPIGWGAPFPTYFGSGVTVRNSAVGGRSVRTWLYSVQTVMDSTGECVLDRDASGNPILQSRWQAMLDATTGMKTGDYLFIQFGINDSSATCDRHVGLDAFKVSYGMMAQAAKDRGARPIFVTPLSSISCSGSTARGSRGEYVTATQEAGAQYNVPVVDLHALSVALYNKHGFCPIPGGDVSASTTGPVGDFFCDDHTHLSQAGAVEIAGLMASALRDQAIPLAAYLK
jgi:lysophospholipase L1-like esterase